MMRSMSSVRNLGSSALADADAQVLPRAALLLLPVVRASAGIGGWTGEIQDR
jgi:hypothetical protein